MSAFNTGWGKITLDKGSEYYYSPEWTVIFWIHVEGGSFLFQPVFFQSLSFRTLLGPHRIEAYEKFQDNHRLLFRAGFRMITRLTSRVMIVLNAAPYLRSLWLKATVTGVRHYVKLWIIQKVGVKNITTILRGCQIYDNGCFVSPRWGGRLYKTPIPTHSQNESS